jgi:DNA-binding GntR family transcriptional regulator
MADAGVADAVPSSIAEKLRNKIACGAFGPGARLGQTELASQFEASRVPVREALKMLTAEGLVEHDPNRGFFVARFSSSEARQLFRLRDLVEDELLTTVEWPGEEALAKLQARAVELEALLNAGNRAEWQIKHRQFHEAIFNLSPNKIFVREAMRLWSLTDRYRTLLPLPRRKSEEREVVDKSDLVKALANQHMPGLLRARGDRRRAFEALVIETLEERGF